MARSLRGRRVMIPSRGDCTQMSRLAHLPLGWDEFERHTVDAVAQPCRLRAVLEDMALMPFAAGAVDFRAGYEQFEVSARFDNFRVNRLPEAGPAGVALVLVFG